jgi:hypothetical protein
MLESIFGKALAIAGVATLNTPLEIVKMRMITNIELVELGRISTPYQSIRDCFKTILASEGPSGFWKGAVVIVGRVFPF